MHYQILKATTTIFLVLSVILLPKSFADLGDSCKTHESCGNYHKYLYCSKTDSKMENGTCACAVTSQIETTTTPTDETIVACPKWREDGESCINNFECNPRFSLSCVQGICQCQPEQIKSEIDFDNYNRIERRVLKGTCLSKLGAACTITQRFRAHRQDTQCVPGASCNDTQNGVCECHQNYGFKPTATGFCGIGIDQQCTQSSSDSCWDNLRCFSPDLQQYNTCKCPHPDYQKYDSKTESCRSALDTPCDPKDINGCIALAECVQLGKNPFTCQCRNGTVTTSAGTCEIAAGFPCEYTSGDYDSEYDYSGIRCSKEAGLVCKSDFQGNFKCSCKNDGDIIDPRDNRCVKSAGVKCSETKECGRYTECKIAPGRAWGVCTCMSGYSAWKGQCDN